MTDTLVKEKELETIKTVSSLTDYKYGWSTDIETDTVPKGLNEDIIKLISSKKKEPQWMLDWRLKAYNIWLKLEEPDWANVTFPEINYQELRYYSSPKSVKDGPKSLDEVDPKLLETYKKLGIPLQEQKMLAGVAVDAVFDSVSVASTYQIQIENLRVIFCQKSESKIKFESSDELFNHLREAGVIFSANPTAIIEVNTGGFITYINTDIRNCGTNMEIIRLALSDYEIISINLKIDETFIK